MEAGILSRMNLSNLISSRVFRPLARFVTSSSSYSTNADSASNNSNSKSGNKNLFSLYIRDNYAEFVKQNPGKLAKTLPLILIFY